jgi:DNA-binding transcriptional LysR family regulator
MQWDDLRYVLAVHREGSVAAAARVLGVSNVTVFRRIEAIEKSLGVRLFDRTKHGYVATPAAAEIVEQAGRIEQQVNDLESRVWKHDSQVRGTVRVTTIDTWGTYILPPLLLKLQKIHPDVRIELVMGLEMLNITRREADIAIRATAAPPENLVGHKLAPLKNFVHAAKSFAASRLRRKRDLASVPWVALDPITIGQPLRINQWIKANGYDPQVVLRCNSVLGTAAAIKAGVGVGVLSSVLARAVGGLVAVSPHLKDLDRDAWILVHPDLREVARVATVYAFLRGELGRTFSEAAGGV